MTDQEILAKVVDILSTQFGTNKADINEATGPEEIEAWDSLSHVTLTSSLETAFQTSFEIDEIMEMENVGAVVTVIARKLGK